MLSKAQVVAVRKAVEKGYIGTCSVIEYRKVKRENGSTGFSEETVLDNIPCKLSFKSAPVLGDGATGSAISQMVKVFMAPDVSVKSGSKLIITQNGVTKEYKGSGEPAIYETHQEIALELFKGWS